MHCKLVLMWNVLCHWKEADFAPPLHKRAASILVPAYTFLSSVVFMLNQWVSFSSPGICLSLSELVLKKSQKSDIFRKICFRLLHAENCQLFRPLSFLQVTVQGSCPSLHKVLCFPFLTVRIEQRQCEALVFHYSLPSVSWTVFSLAKEEFVQISLSPQRSASNVPIPLSLGCGQFPAEDRDVSFSFTSVQ